MKRPVSDILTLAGVPIAFVQIGVDPGVYQPVCPWCAKDIGPRVEALVYGDLFAKCLDVIGPHVMDSACGIALEMKVVILGGVEDGTDDTG